MEPDTPIEQPTAHAQTTQAKPAYDRTTVWLLFVLVLLLIVVVSVSVYVFNSIQKPNGTGSDPVVEVPVEQPEEVTPLSPAAVNDLREQLPIMLAGDAVPAPTISTTADVESVVAAELPDLDEPAVTLITPVVVQNTAESMRPAREATFSTVRNPSALPNDVAFQQNTVVVVVVSVDVNTGVVLAAGSDGRVLRIVTGPDTQFTLSEQLITIANLAVDDVIEVSGLRYADTREIRATDVVLIGVRQLSLQMNN